jgi:hypothetical protein
MYYCEGTADAAAGLSQWNYYHADGQSILLLAGLAGMKFMAGWVQQTARLMNGSESYQENGP